MLLPAPDTKKISDFEERIIEESSARKVLKDRTIYTSSRFPPSNGLPHLTDFGEARFGDENHNEDIMPNAYRAPEVILKTNWDYKVDIWNVAMVVSAFILTPLPNPTWVFARLFPAYGNANFYYIKAWDIVCSHTLFDGKNQDGIFDDRVHVAELIALLGLPPLEVRERSKLSSVFWDEHGM